MTGARHVAVIDIGKTNAKVALVDLAALAEIDVRKIANAPERSGLYPHHDVEKLWTFILGALRDLHVAHGVDAISITTHGATAVLLNDSGELALPVLDYEHDGPDETRAAYETVRPPFSETGSPPLPVGLNIGPQLFWQQDRFPDTFASVANIVMYPQYWAYRLTGVLANEATSLGCHTDLWSPVAADYSSLVDALGWRGLFAPVKPANAILGSILPEISAQTGLSPTTPVACGIHDSNASLLPHVLANRPPFSVVSTGTWVICMAMSGGGKALDPARDTLINVNALGQPVPSSRFMGGREYELLGGASMALFTEADIETVLSDGIALMPSVQPGSGPFPDAISRWTGREPTPGERTVAISFYLALMTATCLDLIGAQGETIVEGPFNKNRLFVEMLAAATGRPVRVQTGGATGTSIGAAMLHDFAGRHVAAPTLLIEPASDLAAYARVWFSAVQ